MIHITRSGVIEYLAIGEDGTRWRTTIQPGDLDEAQKHLSKEELAQVREAWTTELVQKWQDDHPEPTPRPPRPPSTESKVAALEAELATLRAIVNGLREGGTRK